MIRHTWRYRYSRCRAPRIRSFHLSFPLSIDELDHSKLFNDNATMKQTSITGKISSYLKGFIEQESRNIADALTHNNSMVTDLYYNEPTSFIKHYMLLEDDIRRQLEQTMDNYNKFCLLLTFNPISIHPVIYLRMYEKLEVPLEFDMRRLLAKRLTFHHLFDDCWKVLLDNDTTLNDIEDYVGIIVEELRRQNSFSFGIFEFLRSAHTSISNQSIKSTIIDTISYNYGIDKPHIYQYISLTEEFENLQDLEEITAFYELQNQSQSYDVPIKRLIKVICMKRKALFYSNLSSENKNLTDWLPFFIELLALKDQINTPGWLTAVMPRISSFSYLSNPLESARSNLQDNERISYFVVKFLKSSNKLTLSDYDILHVLKDLKPSELRTFFCFYKKLHKHNLRATNIHINNHLFHLALISHDTQILFEILAYFHNNIQTDWISKALSMIFDDSISNFKLLVKKLNKRKSEEKNLKTFEHFLDDLIKNNESNLNKFQAFSQSINRTKIMNPIMRKLLHKISINNMSKDEAIDFFNSLIAGYKNSTTVLIEISRCAIVRNRIMDAELISHLFQMIISRSLFFSEQSNDIPYSFEMKIHNDFQKSYALASYKDKAKLHNSIRAFAQCISNLNVDEIVVVMNILNQAIFKDNFELIQSDLGKHYIFNNLTFDVMRFVYRSHLKSGSNGILKIAEIIKGFNFKSETAQGFLYKSMVAQDTKQALNIFNHHMKNDGYVRRGLLRYILSGIFSSTHHSDKEKIELFYEFKSNLAKSGYNLKLQTVNVIELMNIIVKITKDSPNKSIQSIQTILNYADQNNIPPSVMRYWINKLK